MKKRIPSLLVTAAILAGCSSDKKAENAADKVTVFSSMGGTYEKGLIYCFDSLEQPTRFLDYASLETTPLCAMPNCTHITSTCLAKQVGVNPIMYGEHIYYFQSNHGYEETADGHQFFMKTTLWKANLETSETEVVAEFNDCVPDEWNSDHVLIGNTLWFIGNDMNYSSEDVMDDSWKPSSDTPGAHFMCSIDLETGEYNNYGSVSDAYLESPYWSSGNSAKLKGVYKGKLQIEIQYNLGAQQNGYDYFNDDPDEYFEFRNVEFDMVTKTAAETDRFFPVNVGENYYIGADLKPNGVSDLYVLYDGNEFVIEDEDFNVFVLNGKLFTLTSENWYDLTDFSEHPIPEVLKENGFIRAAYHDGSYIFLNNKHEPVSLTEDELLALE